MKTLVLTLLCMFGVSTSAMAWDGHRSERSSRHERHYEKKCKKCNKHDKRRYDKKHSYEHGRHHDRRYSYHR